VNTKIESIKKPYCRDAEEKSKFFDLLALALLSQGPMSGVKIRIKAYDKIFEPAHDLHHFGLLLMDINQPTVTLSDSGKKYPFDTIILWKLFRSKLKEIISLALSEAMKRSKEIPKGEQQSQAFTFKSDDEKEE